MPEYNEYPPYIGGVAPEDTNQVQHQTLDNLDFERSGHTGFLGSSQNPAQTLSNSFIAGWLTAGNLLKIDSNRKLVAAIAGVDYLEPSSLASYVPYTGATTTIDLNVRQLQTTGSIYGSALISTGYGSTGSQLLGRGAGGTLGSPSATALDQYILFFGARGYTTAFLETSQGTVGIKAAELFSATNQGTYITIENTLIGTTARKQTARFFDDGKLGLFNPQTVSGLPYTGFGRARLHLYDAQTAGDVAIIIGNAGNTTDLVPTASLKFRLRDAVTDIGDSALIQTYKVGTYASAGTRSAGLKVQLETADTLATALDIKPTGINIGTATYNGWDSVQANGYVSGTRFRTPSSWFGTTSLRFDGSSGIVMISEIAELNAVSAFTFSTWVTQDSVTNTDTLFSKPTATASSNSLRINRNSATSFNVQIHNGSTAAYGTFNPQTYFTAGRLHHLVAVYDGGGSTNADKLKVYIDGVAVTLSFTQTIPAVTNNTTGQAATISQASNLAWLGNIKDTRIFSTALSASDVLSLYNSEYTTNMVHQWKLAEGGGLVATDTGSNPVNGVISGGCSWVINEDITINKDLNHGRINLPVGTAREDGIFFGRDTYLYRSGATSLFSNAYLGLGINPTARVHISAGTATAGTSPLKFTSGTLNTAPEAGAIEFLTDKWYATITTGTARKEIALADIALTSGRIPYNTTNGRLTDDVGFTRASNITKIGDGTNYTEIEADGTLKFVGNATAWDDLQFSVSAGRTPAVNAPTYETFTPNTMEYAFSVDDYIQLEANEPPHGWKEGTVASAHIHFALKTAQNTGANRYAKFELIFAVCDASGVWAEATAIPLEYTIPTGSVALQGFLLGGGSLNLSGFHIGSQIKCRAKRIAATTGTEYADDVYITQVGLHMELDTVGSREISTK